MNWRTRHGPGHVAAEPSQVLVGVHQDADRDSSSGAGVNQSPEFLLLASFGFVPGLETKLYV